MNSETLQTKPALDVGRLLNAFGVDATIGEIAAVLYVPRKTVSLWIDNPNTQLDPIDADRYAMLIDRHPYFVWGWDWVDAE